MTEKICIGSGLNTSSLPGSKMPPLDAMLSDYEKQDMTHVEITARRIDVIVGGRIIEERAAVVGDLLQRHDLKYVLHADHAFNFMDTPNLEMHRNVAHASVELCRRYGMTSMVMHSGNAPKDVWDYSSKRLLEQEREELKRLGDVAADAGVQVAVENLIADPSGMRVVSGADPRPLNEQLNAVNHPAICGCLDFGHAFLSAPVLNFPFVDAIAEFSEMVGHLHLHDNFGIPNTRVYKDEGSRISLGIGDLHLPMGWGTIPWKELLPRMKFREGTYAMIELRGRYREVEDKVATCARHFADYWNGEIDLDAALDTVQWPEKM